MGAQVHYWISFDIFHILSDPKYFCFSGFLKEIRFMTHVVSAGHLVCAGFLCSALWTYGLI